METSRVLLVGVGPAYREHLRVEAARRGSNIISIDAKISDVPIDADTVLCVFEATGEGEKVFEQVRAVREVVRDTPLVVLASDLDDDAVDRVMGLGVADAIRLPAPFDRIAERCFAQAASRTRGLRVLEEIVGESRPMRVLRREIVAVAGTDSTVLVTGETGTGKGLVAGVIHRLSERSGRSFVQVDCAALSPTIVESELFGHERGSFTGAISRRPGRFELAGEGTIFLDEIGELDSGLQSKLLRVLEDREYERIGGVETLAMKARVIAATSRNLRRQIREGRFRADLYFRLNVFHLSMPSLRERTSDIPLLVRSGLGRLTRRLRVKMPNPTDEFLARLTAYSWPGNVRELMNVLERLLVRRAGDTLEASDLDGLLEAELWQTEREASWQEPAIAMRYRAFQPDGRDELSEIIAALTLSRGNVARAARRLQIPRSTLRYRMRKYGVAGLVPKD